MLLFVVIFLVAGLTLVHFGRKFEYDAKRAADWPVVAGDLEHCEVVELRGLGVGDFGSWKLRIRYSYVVNGIKYHSDRYAFGYGDGRDDRKHKLVADALRAQSHVSVHYDPAHPSESVLSTEPQSNVTNLGYAGLVMAAIAAFIWLVVG